MPVKVPVREPIGEVSVILPVMPFTVLGLGSSGDGDGDGSGSGMEKVVGKLSVRRVIVCIVRVFWRCIVVYGDWS